MNLSASQRRELDWLSRNGHPAHLRPKALALLNLADGLPLRRTAKIFRFTRASLYLWKARYLREGIEGLEVHSGRGRKARAEVLALAFDHRRQLEELGGKDRIRGFKRLVAEGLATQAAAGAIVDDRYGEEALFTLSGKGRWLARPVEVREGEGEKLMWARLEPHHGFVLNFEIDFKHPAVDATGQQVIFDMGSGRYKRDIARARTFGFSKDVAAMRSRGLTLGGAMDNAIVVDDSRVLNAEGLRYDVQTDRSGKLIPWNIAGPTCDSVDVCMRDEMFPQDMQEGDFIYIANAGAYTTAYASNFNGFPLPDVRII